MENGALREPLLPSHNSNGPQRPISHTFYGKLTLFPLVIIIILLAALFLFSRGESPFTLAYYRSPAARYGIGGLVCIILAAIFIFMLLRWVVIRVTFSFDATQLTVVKRGVLRRTTLSFSLDDISLHYVRSHILEDQAWLSLVVREGDLFYKIASWKGKGDQKTRFLDLFFALQRRLGEYAPETTLRKQEATTELVGAQEVVLVSPFASRLHVLSLEQRRTGGSSMYGSAASATCTDDISLVDCDTFTTHFALRKDAGRPVRPR